MDYDADILSEINKAVREMRASIKEFELASMFKDYGKTKKKNIIGTKEEEKMKELDNKGKFAELYIYCKS